MRLVKGFGIPSEISTEWHPPGFNFMGPGTHVFERVVNHELPTSRTDALALVHDIEYMIGTSIPKELDKADDQAIANSDYSLSGMIMKAGLSIRKALQLKMANRNTLEETHEQQRIGLYLKNKVLSDSEYVYLLNLYNVRFQDD